MNVVHFFTPLPTKVGVNVDRKELDATITNRTGFMWDLWVNAKTKTGILAAVKSYVEEQSSKPPTS